MSPLHSLRCTPFTGPQGFSSTRKLVKRGCPTNKHVQLICASAKAAELLAAADAKYNANDRLAAMNLYEAALQEKGLTRRQKQHALFSSTCVHASFGDVELAQITLKEAIQEGIDWEQGMQDPDLVKPKSSQQILIQLKRFNQSLLSARARSLATSPAPMAAPVRSSRSSDDFDLKNVLGTPTSELELDATPIGIAKRVAGLLVLLIGLFVALFYGGLAYWPLDRTLSQDDMSSISALYPDN